MSAGGDAFAEMLQARFERNRPLLARLTRTAAYRSGVDPDIQAANQAALLADEQQAQQRQQELVDAAAADHRERVRQSRQ